MPLETVITAPPWFTGPDADSERTRLARLFYFEQNNPMTEASKETLRHEAIKHRERIHNFSNEDPDAAISLFFETIKPKQGQSVALYWPTDKEFDPTGIMAQLLEDGFVCALPVVKKDTRILQFVRWQDGDPMEFGPYNIQQPKLTDKSEVVEPDILIVPLLAFDRKGYRLGYGGGYYDASLRDLRQKKEIVAVGIGFAQQAVIFNLPVEPHDEKLDWVITPQKAHYFGD